jgi:hypothetical protein
MIDVLSGQWHAGSSPFAWVRTVDQILAKAVNNLQPILNRDTR